MPADLRLLRGAHSGARARSTIEPNWASHSTFRRPRSCLVITTSVCGRGKRAHPYAGGLSLACHHPRALSPASLTALDRHPPITTRTTTEPAPRHLPNVQALRSTRRAPGLAAALHSRGFLTAAAYKLAQKQMPKMSETEKVALGCGTVGSDLC